MATYVFTVNGVTKSIQHESLSISETANGLGTLSAKILSLDGSYRPALGQEVTLTRDGTRIFGGIIDGAPEGGLGGYGVVPIVTTINAVDFNVFASWRRVIQIIPAGNLKAFLTAIMPYLTPYGVSLHASQANGPALPELVYDGRTLQDILDEVKDMTGWTWDIDYNKVLRMTEPGTVAAPFNITTVNKYAIGDILVEPTDEDYANRVILLAGTGEEEVTETFTLTAASVIGLTYQIFSHRGYLTRANGGSPFTETVGSLGANWIVDSVANTLTRVVVGTSTPAPITDTVTIVFTASFPYVAQADNVPAQLGGTYIRETIRTIEELFDATVADLLVDAYLTRYSATPRIVNYETMQHDLHPGQTQTITVAERNLSGYWLITDVTMRNTRGNAVRYSVTAIEGSSYIDTWKDTFREWSGTSSSSSSGGSSFVINEGAVGVKTHDWGGSRERSPFGSSGTASTPVVEWKPFVAYDTIPRVVTVCVRTDNAATSVTPRIAKWNGAAWVADTTGSASTSTAADGAEQTITFTPVVGTRYRLEIARSNTSNLVFGIGWE